jgi:hypothetical protein
MTGIYTLIKERRVANKPQYSVTLREIDTNRVLEWYGQEIPVLRDAIKLAVKHGHLIGFELYEHKTRPKKQED